MKLTTIIQKKWRSINDEGDEDTLNILLPVLVTSGIVSDAKQRKSRGPNHFRESGWWKNGCQNWSSRLNRQTFELVLSVLTPFIVKQPTNMKPTPTPTKTLLAFTLYCLAHGYSFPTVGALFVITESLVSITFNKVVRILIVAIYSFVPNCRSGGQIANVGKKPLKLIYLS